MNYFHVDVFSSRVLKGNGLTVVFLQESLSNQQLLEITREFRQFETIYIYPQNSDGAFPAKIFTMDEELLFAGHPIIGAGAVVHNKFFSKNKEIKILFELGKRHIQVFSEKKNDYYQVTMNQGEATFIKKVEKTSYSHVAEALNIQNSDIDKNYSIEVVSTGLPYLLVPLCNNISTCRIVHKNFLSSFGAKFVYIFDTNIFECRTWDNSGKTEDVATGSAAGPLCAYLVKNNVKNPEEIIEIQQGKFMNRPSIIKGCISQNNDVFITGDVSFFASGTINI
jgi:PhzF family phenazine biosynthesis protein